MKGGHSESGHLPFPTIQVAVEEDGHMSLNPIQQLPRLRIPKWIIILLGTLVAVFAIIQLKAYHTQSVEESRRCDCIMHLKQITLAILSYQDKYGSLPPAVTTDSNGVPMHSWRVLILPFLDAADLYEKYDFAEPWNSPHNSRLQEVVDNRFRCPSCGLEKAETNYVAVTGSGTMWAVIGVAVTDKEMEETSPRVLVVEMPQMKLNWMEPRDIGVDEAVSIIAHAKEEGRFIHSRGIQYVDTAQRLRVFSTEASASDIKSILLGSGYEGK